MADKSIKFEAAIDPKVSPKMERMLKAYGQLTQKAFAAKDIQKYNKEFDKTLKSMEKHIKLSKTQAEVLRNGPIKAMQEQERVFERIVKRAERAQHILNDTGYAERWLRRKMKSEGITQWTDPDAYKLYRGQAMARAHSRAAYAQGDLDAGLGEVQKRIELQQDEDKRKRMDKVSTAMALGAAISSGAAAVGAAGDVYFGHSMRKAGFQAQSASFAGRLYNDITNGDFTGIAALGIDPARFRGMVSDAYTNSRLQQTMEGVGAVGGMITGGAQTALGVGMMGSGVGAGIGAMNAAQGGSNLANSTANLGRMIGNAAAGRTSADTASAAIQGMEYLRQLDPVRLRQMQELQGRVVQAGEFGGELAGASGTNPWLVMKQIQDTGISKGGIGNFDQNMAIFEGLRGVTSTKAALDPTLLGTAMSAPFSLGIGRQSAVQGMGALSMMRGGMMDSGDKLFELMRKSMALGIEDSKLKETIVSTLPTLVESSGGGRAGNLSAADAAMQMADEIARRHGGPMQQQDILKGASGVQFGNMVTGGASPWAPVNVLSMAGGRQAAAKHGIKATTGMLLAQMGAETLLTDPDAAKDMLIAEDKKFLDKDVRMAALRDIASGAYKGVGRAMRGMNIYQQAAAIAKDGGGDYNTILANLKRGRGDLKDVAVPSDQQAVNFTVDQAAAMAAQGKQAQATGYNQSAAFGNTEMQGQLSNTMEAAKVIVRSLGEISAKGGDLERLRNVPDLVDRLAGSIEKLGRATAKALDEPWQPDSVDSAK